MINSLMSLSDLPDDILGLISCLLNGFDNCSLWMASGSKLKQRLVNNIIINFDIKYTTPGRFLWPGNFLKKLKRLSRLSLVVDKDVNYIPLENIEFFPIETLKYFKLNCEYLEDILEQQQFDDSIDPTGPTTSSNDYNCIKLNSLYPNLEHFELGHTTSYLHANLPIDLLRFLPKKLNTFIMHPYLVLEQNLPKQNVDVYIASLPRSLTSLYIQLPNKEPSLDTYFLPPNLTSLTTNIMIEENSYMTIPQTLKHPNTCIVHYDLQKLSPFLPAGLESLTVCSSSLVDASLSHLENLVSCDISYIKMRSAPKPEDSRFTTKYPPNLKNCSLSSSSTQKLNLPPFPIGLVDLSLNISTEFTHDFFAALPQTITKLSLLHSEQGPLEFYKLLPQNLQSFYSTIPIRDKMSSLPESLTDLELLPYLPCEMISEDDRFPPKLKKLSLNRIEDIPKSILKALPVDLVSLQLESESTIDDEVIASLPRGLTDLRLDTPLDLTDACASKYPRNLEFLYLSEWKSFNHNITNKTIGQLPRTLKHLTLGKISTLTDSCIKHLPRHLTELNMPLCKSITWRCCKNLPKYIKSLYLHRSIFWTAESLKDLPKYLKDFHVGVADIKQAFDKMISNN